MLWGHVVALVCVQAIVPVSTTDARVNVLAARARFAPDAQGHTRVALDLSVEALYVTPRNTLRFAYQVEVVAPSSR